VTADQPVSGDFFDLSVVVTQPPSVCTRPTPVADGTVLRAQDLLQAGPPPTATCIGTLDHALFYAATLLPQQTIWVSSAANATPNMPGSSPAVLSLRPACGGDDPLCFTAGGDGMFTNFTSMPMPIIIEASVANPSNVGAFDLQVSMPPPQAGITVTPQAGLVTTEAGGSATFQIVLTSPPRAPVMIGVASDTTGEGLASPASVQFDETSWNQPRTVTVTGVDDHVADGARAYLIVTSAAVSDDPSYAGLDAADVAVTNLDDEPGLLVGGAEALSTSESGARATFTARLTRAPTATVRTALTSSDVAEGTVSPSELVFSPANWNVPQTVTVTGVDDVLVDGTQTYAVVTGAWVGGDASYAGQDPPDVAVHNRDDDQRAVGTKLLSGASVCDDLDPIAVDGFGTIYVLMHCGGVMSVVTSGDGGVTFSAPVPLPSILQTATWGGLTAGEGGSAYVVAGTTTGLAFTRTTDGGATWSSPQLLAPSTEFGFQMASAGKVVVVVGSARDVILWRSIDGGRTFLPQTRTDTWIPTVVMAPDGATIVWLLDAPSKHDLEKSTDGGATFASIGQVDVLENPIVIGVHSAFIWMDDAMNVLDLTDASVTMTVPNFPLGLTVADDADNLTTVTGPDAAGHLSATRLEAGAAAASPAKVLGPGGPSTSAVALSRKAIATTSASGGLILFSVTTWP